MDNEEDAEVPRKQPRVWTRDLHLPPGHLPDGCSRSSSTSSRRCRRRLDPAEAAAPAAPRRKRRDVPSRGCRRTPRTGAADRRAARERLACVDIAGAGDVHVEAVLAGRMSSRVDRVCLAADCGARARLRRAPARTRSACSTSVGRGLASTGRAATTRSSRTQPPPPHACTATTTGCEHTEGEPRRASRRPRAAPPRRCRRAATRGSTPARRAPGCRPCMHAAVCRATRP